MPPGPILPLRGAGLGAPPGADMALANFRILVVKSFHGVGEVEDVDEKKGGK